MVQAGLKFTLKFRVTLNSDSPDFIFPGLGIQCPPSHLVHVIDVKS